MLVNTLPFYSAPMVWKASNNMIRTMLPANMDIDIGMDKDMNIQ